ncbi:MAG: DUF2177 family protein [Rhizobiaceae bacterium]|nr:DUF2177 family protein [Rhizobiaceae bacterium]
MTRYLIAYAMTAIVFFSVDYVWLSKIARNFYFERLGPLMLDKPNIGAALGFYLMYIAGIIIFAVAPGLKHGSLWYAMGYGALFGFFTYATYDMTNYATLKNWPVSIVFVDIAWGVFLTGASASLGYLGTQMLSKG